MLLNWTYSFLIFITNLYCCACKQYHNYTLYRGILTNQVQMDFVEGVISKYDGNFWIPPSIPFKPVDFIISPENKIQFNADVETMQLNLTTIIDDVQSTFDIHKIKPYTKHKTSSFDWTDYYRLNDIYAWLEDLSSEYPLEMKLLKIGKTHKDRDILAVRIALNGSKFRVGPIVKVVHNDEFNDHFEGCWRFTNNPVYKVRYNFRSKVMIEGGIHAREWISPALVTYLIDKIIHSSTSNNYYLKEMAKTYEWYFVPVLNPDGYEYSHTDDRLWRKNRNVYGVDLNRNFGHKFGTLGASYNQFAENYCGPKPFSEKETIAIANLVRSISEDMEYYLAFHSYSQYIIIPYLSNRTYLDNFFEVKKLCMAAAKQIRRRYNTLYTVGISYETLGYLASGTSADWVKEEFKTPYVVVFELPDNGKFGFALPPEKIMPVCRETVDGLISLLIPQTMRFRKPHKIHKHKRNRQYINIVDNIVIVSGVILLITAHF